MIRHLIHREIDKDRWDAHLLNSGNRLWYAQSWVLDLASPGWGALIDEESAAMMPLTWRRKWGVDYLFQPLGLQQLGVFAPDPSHAETTRLLNAVPERFNYWDICIQETAGINVATDIHVEQRPNQTLLLDKPVDELRKAYAKNHLRNLKTEAPLEQASMDAHSFADLFRRTTGARYGKDALKGFDEFERIIEEGVRRGQCEVIALKLKDEVIAAACFATWQGRTIMLKSANTEAGMESMAMFHLLDSWIARHAGTGLLLDFAGSGTPSVARFNAGFGASSGVYLRLVRNRLPMPIRWLKR